MAFTPEDGTGLSDANSYVTIAYADEYFINRGNADWSLLTFSQKQVALVKGTDYIESRYSRTQGVALNSDQALMFPAYGMYNSDGYLIDSNSVPDKVKQATCILAIEVIDGTDINAPIDRATKKEKAGPVEVEYMDSSLPETIYSQVNGLVGGYLSMNGPISSQGRLVRG